MTPMSPKRIQRQRVKGWRMPEGAVYVGRPTKWGNPYCACDRYEHDAMHVDTWTDAVDSYRQAVRKNDTGDRFHRECPTSDEIRAELAGKDLACWCPLAGPCHADVLLEIANAGESA